MSDQRYDHSKHDPNEFSDNWKVRYAQPGNYYVVVWFKAKPGQKVSREAAYREALTELKRRTDVLAISTIEAAER